MLCYWCTVVNRVPAETLYLLFWLFTCIVEYKQIHIIMKINMSFSVNRDNISNQSIIFYQHCIAICNFMCMKHRSCSSHAQLTDTHSFTSRPSCIPCEQLLDIRRKLSRDRQHDSVNRWGWYEEVSVVVAAEEGRARQKLFHPGGVGKSPVRGISQNNPTGAAREMDWKGPQGRATAVPKKGRQGRRQGYEHDATNVPLRSPSTHRPPINAPTSALPAAAGACSLPAHILVIMVWINQIST